MYILVFLQLDEEYICVTDNVILLLEKHEQEMDQQLEHFLVDEFSTQTHDDADCHDS